MKTAYSKNGEKAIVETTLKDVGCIKGSNRTLLLESVYIRSHHLCLFYHHKYHYEWLKPILKSSTNTKTGKNNRKKTSFRLTLGKNSTFNHNA